VWIIQVILSVAFLAMIVHDVRTCGGTGHHGEWPGEVEPPDSGGLPMTKEEPHGSD
jgi:hypothetical protein